MNSTFSLFLLSEVKLFFPLFGDQQPCIKFIFPSTMYLQLLYGHKEVCEKWDFWQQLHPKYKYSFDKVSFKMKRWITWIFGTEKCIFWWSWKPRTKNLLTLHKEVRNCSLSTLIFPYLKVKEDLNIKGCSE